MVENVLKMREFVSKIVVPQSDDVHYYLDFEKCVGYEKDFSEIQMMVDVDIFEKAEEVQAIRDRYQEKAEAISFSNSDFKDVPKEEDSEMMDHD
jgi:hypothetical protein